MIRRNIMYLRPSNFYKSFIIETNQSKINSFGRPTANYDDSKKRLFGILTEADPNQKFRWEQLQHPITHMIVQDGKPQAKQEDKLIFENRVFLIKGIDDLGSLGISTIYYVEERFDIK